MRRDSRYTLRPGTWPWYPKGQEGYSRPSFYLIGGIVFFLGMAWLNGCSSNSKPASAPTKQEVQTDSDRFFKNLEKEETKKETKEDYP